MVMFFMLRWIFGLPFKMLNNFVSCNAFRAALLLPPSLSMGCQQCNCNVWDRCIKVLDVAVRF